MTQQPDLLSTVITLRNPEPVSLAYDQGRALAAQFLAWVQEIDPELSEKLHSPDRLPRAFTVSNLMDLPRPRKGTVYLSKESRVWFRLTSISPTLTGFLLNRLLPKLSNTLTLGNSRFLIDSVSRDPEDHLWAGQAGYQDLVNIYLLGKAPPKVRYYFNSPTTFHTHQLHLPYVIPAMAIRTWLKAWNAFAPVTFSASLLAKVEKSVGVSYYKMHSAPVRFGKATFIGGKGRCDFIVLNTDPYWRHVVNVLSAFAFYAGTGVKTALGMGQTRLLGAGHYRGLNGQGG